MTTNVITWQDIVKTRRHSVTGAFDMRLVSFLVPVLLLTGCAGTPEPETVANVNEPDWYRTAGHWVARGLTTVVKSNHPERHDH